MRSSNRTRSGQSLGSFDDRLVGLEATGPWSPDSPDAGLPCFDEVVLPHLDAAFRLARWLIGNEQDAEDAVQDAAMRAFRYFRTYTGGNGRAWFLRIVRNSCHRSWARRIEHETDPFDESAHSEALAAVTPESLLLKSDNDLAVRRAVEQLPDRFRSLLVLREFEELSYRELAEILEIPVGTVMSGLSRARRALHVVLARDHAPVGELLT
jgi:RNA polymerase sigma-70 factor (ECF subfamily)